MRGWTVVALCAVALLVAMALGVGYGSGTAGLGDLLATGSRAQQIVVGYRLPRVLLGAVAGAGLAAVGAALQGVLRNPLADPYILGVSGGAALGATVAIVAGVGGGALAAAASVPVASFAGGVGATALVWTLGRSGRAGGASILLAGVVINSIAYACILFVEAFAEPGRLQSLVWWLMGYLDAPSWPQLGFVTLYAVAGMAVLIADAARINVLSLGDEPAESLGIEVRALERRTLFACAAVVGAVVSVTGPVGFVGLVVPQAHAAPHRPGPARSPARLDLRRAPRRSSRATSPCASSRPSSTPRSRSAPSPPCSAARCSSRSSSDRDPAESPVTILEEKRESRQAAKPPGEERGSQEGRKVGRLLGFSSRRAARYRANDASRPTPSSGGNARAPSDLPTFLSPLSAGRLGGLAALLSPIDEVIWL